MLLHSPPSRCILILSSHIWLDHLSGLFPSNFPTKTLYTPLFSPIIATCPAHFILVSITRTATGEDHRSLRSSLCSFLHSFVTSSLSAPNILLNTLFSNTPSLRPSLRVSDQVSHPYKTTGKSTLVYILIFIFLCSKLNTKYSAPNDTKHCLNAVCFNFCKNGIMIC